MSIKTHKGMKIIGIIPARYGSTRLMGKPLVDIGGKSMIRRVYEQAKQASLLSDVWVATDDQQIFEEVQGFGGQVVMTDSSHQSGTERCCEAMQKIGSDSAVIVNIQGDEPFIYPQQIDELCRLFTTANIQIATLIQPIDTLAELTAPNRPKVVVNEHLEALYFSRQTIPFLRSFSGETVSEKWLQQHTFYKHIGLYGYRSEVLKRLVSLSPTILEQAEGLEQLRWLQHGFTIQTAITNFDTFSIDTPEDLAVAKRKIL